MAANELSNEAEQLDDHMSFDVFDLQVAIGCAAG